MTNILDHVGLSATDFKASMRFYVAALGALGVTPISEFTEGGFSYAGFGKERPTFWVGDGAKVQAGVHVAFTAANRAEVDAFYAAAMAHGGRDNGPPGIRAHYHPNYYGACVLDPDGHNIEAVCHGAE